MKAVADAQAAQRSLDPSSVPGLAEAKRMLQVIGARMEGNDYTRLKWRREIFSLVPVYGAPALWITVAPSDIHSPLLVYFGGKDIKLPLHGPDVDAKLPGYRQRLSFIARDPVASAEYFAVVAQAFLRCLVGLNQHTVPEEQRLGVFGEVSTFYSTVEAQGRGSLHMHLLVWLRYCPSPEELERRLSDPALSKTIFQYLQDIICETEAPMHLFGESSAADSKSADADNDAAMNPASAPAAGSTPRLDVAKSLEAYKSHLEVCTFNLREPFIETTMFARKRTSSGLRSRTSWPLKSR